LFEHSKVILAVRYYPPTNNCAYTYYYEIHK